MSHEPIYAPWTDQQVENLNLLQRHPNFHGYTCGSDVHLEHQLLIATNDGWICPLKCDYSQKWASDWALNNRWTEM